MIPAILNSWYKRYTNVQTQTSSSDIRQCGLIEVSLHNQIYILNCFHCADEFPIWNWENFIAHMNSVHLFADEHIERYKSNSIIGQIEENIIPVFDDIILEREQNDDLNDNNIEFVSFGSSSFSNDFPINNDQYKNNKEGEDFSRVMFTSEAERDNAIVFKGVTIRSIRAPITKDNSVKSLPVRHSSNSGSNTRQNKSVNGPKEDNTDLDEVVLFEKPYDNDESENDEEESQSSRNIILFTKTDPAIVNHFLDLLQAHPVLYTYRRGPVTAYDEAVSKMTINLNDKWDLNVHHTAIAESVMRTRYWFKYVLQRLADKPQTYRTKFWLYFKKCAEFLPTENLVQPPARLRCSICHKYILNAIQLQNHNFIEHNEGELYYKCNQCDKRFAQPGEKQQHVRSEHKRIKLTKITEQEANDAGCVCDVCGKKFTTIAICKQHRKRHDKPLFNCDLCPKGFHLSFLLKEHKRYHEQKFEFVCDECGHAFLHKRTLKQHIKGVHKREIRCKICGIAYTNHMSVVRHQKRDHLVLEGTNEELEQRLIANKIQRVIDPETHTYSFVCGLCGLKCSGKRPFGLVRHMMKKHGYVPIDQKWRTKKPRINSKTINTDPITHTCDSDDDQEDHKAVNTIIAVDSQEQQELLKENND